MKVVTLPERVDLAAEGLLAELRAAALAGDVVIEAAHVLRVDAAGLQLLYALCAATNVTWRAPSRALTDAAATLGLASALKLEGNR